MAWSAFDIQQLKKAMATGAEFIAYDNGKQVKYRTLSEQIKLLRMMEEEVNGSTSINNRIANTGYRR